MKSILASIIFVDIIILWIIFNYCYSWHKKRDLIQSSPKVAAITNKDLTIKGEKSSICIPDILYKFPRETKRLYISLPAEHAVQALEEALDTKRFDVITQVIVNYLLRLNPQGRNIRHQITKTLSEDVSITSIIIDLAHKTASVTETMTLLHHSTQDIDLLLYLFN